MGSSSLRCSGFISIIMNTTYISTYIYINYRWISVCDIEQNDHRWRAWWTRAATAYDRGDCWRHKTVQHSLFCGPVSHTTIRCKYRNYINTNPGVVFFVDFRGWGCIVEGVLVITASCSICLVSVFFRIIYSFV